MPTERWRPVLGFEGFYEVSDTGNVRTMTRTFMRRHNKTSQLVEYTYKGIPMKPWINTTTDYLMVTLSKKNVRQHLTVHTAVLSAFVGQRPDGNVACHYNGNRRDNRLVNLRWDTYSGNVADTKRHGRQPIGEQIHFAKLDESSVRAIRVRLTHGETCKSISGDYGVTPEAIGYIKNRRNWAWLE